MRTLQPYFGLIGAGDARATALGRFLHSAHTTFAFCLAILTGNDLLFHFVRGSYAIYGIDYLLKTIVLLIAWRAASTLPPALVRKDPWYTRLGILVLCFVFVFVASAAGIVLDPGWRLFEWPPIASPTLRIFD